MLTMKLMERKVLRHRSPLAKTLTLGQELDVSEIAGISARLE
jgi:hypothetical protein